MTLMIDQTPLDARRYLESVGDIFAVFDARTQDSGNVSYGVATHGVRYFVKTAGDPSVKGSLLDHAGRIAVLRNAVTLARSVHHRSLPKLLNVVSTATGPMLVYAWVEGDLIGVPARQRADRGSAFQRFRALPLSEILAAIETIIEAHVELAKKGWIACDFYDGSIIYDFARKEVHLVDLDHYHLGPFENEMGRMLGSTRFMAPEEFMRGAIIDETTTVFTLGRTLSVFAGDGTLAQGVFRGSDALHELMCRACAVERALRFQRVADFSRAWQAAQQ